MTAGRAPGRFGRDAGQATVELVALLPVLLAVAATVFCVLAAGRAREVAASAAQAGAMALIRDADPRAAARDVIPAADRRRARIDVRGRRVTVRVVPRVPVRDLARRLAATSSADAGPRA
jgi:hypothetical protein